MEDLVAQALGPLDLLGADGEANLERAEPAEARRQAAILQAAARKPPLQAQGRERREGSEGSERREGQAQPGKGIGDEPRPERPGALPRQATDHRAHPRAARFAVSPAIHRPWRPTPS